MQGRFLKYLQNPKWFLLYLDNHNIIHLDDEKYLKTEYSIYLNKSLNLDNPKTYNEKLQWLKLHDKNPLYTQLVDKYEVKKYISKLIGKEYVIPTLGIYNSFDEIDFESLPNKFVIKCTHDSGGVVICDDKSLFNVKKAKKYINKRLKSNYFAMHREWPYKNVKPRIIIEQYIKNNGSEDLIDYKFFCFNGEPKILLNCSNRKTNLEETWYNMSYDLLDIKEGNHPTNTSIKKPENFEFMKKISKTLSKDMPFIRVDFYEVNGQIYVGELTFYPASGYERFDPEKWDSILGEWINISKVRMKNNEK